MKNYFSENLKLLRKSRTLTVKDLSTTLKVSEATLLNWERGKHYPPVDKLLIIKKLFDNVNLDDLICRELTFKFVYYSKESSDQD